MSSSSALHNNEGHMSQHRHTPSYSYTPNNNPISNSNKLHQSKFSYNNSHLNQSNSNDQSDYQIVAEFQLRREREKTRILEERLHNKEIFIQQMKEYQDELTLAFEKCQEELMGARKTIEKFQVIEREQLEEITQLKHLVIRLEDQVNLRQNGRNKDKRHYSSVKQIQKQQEDEDYQQLAQENENQQSFFKIKAKSVQNKKKGRQQRSKTQMNYQEQSPEGKFRDSLEEELIRNSRKIAKFLKQFLMMSQCFLGQIPNGPLKYRLKLAWKWIKQVVKQWNEQEKQKITWLEFLKKAEQRIKIPNDADDFEKLQRILKHLKTNK